MRAHASIFSDFPFEAAWAQRLVTGWKFAWRAASRFVAGSTIQEAIIVVKN
jgi:hypothetical protein